MTSSIHLRENWVSLSLCDIFSIFYSLLLNSKFEISVPKHTKSVNTQNEMKNMNISFLFLVCVFLLTPLLHFPCFSLRDILCLYLMWKVDIWLYVSTFHLVCYFFKTFFCLIASIIGSLLLACVKLWFPTMLCWL